jgi:hypothetical protein
MVEGIRKRAIQVLTHDMVNDRIVWLLEQVKKSEKIQIMIKPSPNYPLNCIVL